MIITKPQQNVMILISILVTSFHCSNGSYASEQRKDLSYFREEYPKALKTLKSSYANVRIKGSWVRRSKSNNQLLEPNLVPKLEVTDQGEIKKLVLTTVKMGNPDPKTITKSEFVLVLGVNQIFSLRKTQSTENDYVIDFSEKRDVQISSRYNTPKETEFIKRGDKYSRCVYQHESLKLGNLFDQDRYILQSGEEIVTSEHKIFRVHFINSKQSNLSIVGTVEFLPEQYWAMKQIEIKASIPVKAANTSRMTRIEVKSTAVVEYEEVEKNSIPKPTKLTYSDNNEITEFKYEEVTLGVKIPLNEFTLNLFGLPDINSPPSDPVEDHKIFWIIGLAIALLMLAVVVHRRQS